MIKKILDILQKEARMPAEKIATRLGVRAEEVAETIEKLEKDHVILGYKAIINPEKSTSELIHSFIEVQVTPQRDKGFDDVAERLYKFPEVKTLYLMSGGYDLLLIVEGKTLLEVAQFVSEKLAVLEGVRGTRTHFLLKKYKEDGVIFKEQPEHQRLPVSP